MWRQRRGTPVARCLGGQRETGRPPLQSTGGRPMLAPSAAAAGAATKGE
ncbi:MAG: hypothetical protein AVDCRST_MAG59-4642 [uncultured Thermomicrobiales bacterium]|uniref:Uncharacterized protein n=1 Tax=uncultured Thermomicrobiales bacterium TaxID=1645740 RepID=A0A6J4VKW9_9BACT|nr:MAG: hypothetical protein AVDCRST_MAG59-4642 [uncultured Thermomicrobiales bacterium]